MVFKEYFNCFEMTHHEVRLCLQYLSCVVNQLYETG